MLYVIHLPQHFKPVYYELPGAIGIGIYLTLAVPGAAAGAVKKLLGATANRADAAVGRQPAISAAGTFLYEKTRLFLH